MIVGAQAATSWNALCLRNDEKGRLTNAGPDAAEVLEFRLIVLINDVYVPLMGVMSVGDPRVNRVVEPWLLQVIQQMFWLKIELLMVQSPALAKDTLANFSKLGPLASVMGQWFEIQFSQEVPSPLSEEGSIVTQELELVEGSMVTELLSHNPAVWMVWWLDVGRLSVILRGFDLVSADHLRDAQALVARTTFRSRQTTVVPAMPAPFTDLSYALKIGEALQDITHKMNPHPEYPISHGYTYPHSSASAVLSAPATAPFPDANASALLPNHPPQFPFNQSANNQPHFPSVSYPVRYPIVNALSGGVRVRENDATSASSPSSVPSRSLPGVSSASLGSLTFLSTRTPLTSSKSLRSIGWERVREDDHDDDNETPALVQFDHVVRMAGAENWSPLDPKQVEAAVDMAVRAFNDHEVNFVVTNLVARGVFGQLTRLEKKNVIDTPPRKMWHTLAVDGDLLTLLEATHRRSKRLDVLGESMQHSSECAKSVSQVRSAFKHPWFEDYIKTLFIKRLANWVAQSELPPENEGRDEVTHPHAWEVLSVSDLLRLQPRLNTKFSLELNEAADLGSVIFALQQLNDEVNGILRTTQNDWQMIVNQLLDQIILPHAKMDAETHVSAMIIKFALNLAGAEETSLRELQTRIPTNSNELAELVKTSPGCSDDETFERVAGPLLAEIRDSTSNPGPIIDKFATNSLGGLPLNFDANFETVQLHAFIDAYNQNNRMEAQLAAECIDEIAGQIAALAALFVDPDKPIVKSDKPTAPEKPLRVNKNVIPKSKPWFGFSDEPPPGSSPDPTSESQPPLPPVAAGQTEKFTPAARAKLIKVAAASSPRIVLLGPVEQSIAAKAAIEYAESQDSILPWNRMSEERASAALFEQLCAAGGRGRLLEKPVPNNPEEEDEEGNAREGSGREGNGRDGNARERREEGGAPQRRLSPSMEFDGPVVSGPRPYQRVVCLVGGGASADACDELRMWGGGSMLWQNTTYFGVVPGRVAVKAERAVLPPCVGQFSLDGAWLHEQASKELEGSISLGDRDRWSMYSTHSGEAHDTLTPLALYFTLNYIAELPQEEGPVHLVLVYKSDPASPADIEPPETPMVKPYEDDANWDTACSNIQTFAVDQASIQAAAARKAPGYPSNLAYVTAVCTDSRGGKCPTFTKWRRLFKGSGFIYHEIRHTRQAGWEHAWYDQSGNPVSDQNHPETKWPQKLPAPHL